MRALIISRKKADGIGGLSRFYAELSKNFPAPHYNLDPNCLTNLFKLPFLKPTHIYLCDGTLLPLGFILKSIFKKPLIVTTHGLDLTYTNPIYQMMVRWLLPKADAVILDSHPTKPLLRNFKLKKKAEVISLGITTEHLKNHQPIKVALNNKIVMTTVGNLVKRKGHLWFIENVMPNLPKNFIYLIVGSGPEGKSIRSQVKKMHLSKKVLLLGQLTHPELGFVLSKTDIYVCPNQKEPGTFESFGIASGEAAGLGIPVVASKVDGIPQAIKHNKNGLLVEPEANHFINSLISLKNPTLRKNLGSKAKIYTKKYYNWPKTADKYFRVFAGLGKN